MSANENNATEPKAPLNEEAPAAGTEEEEDFDLMAHKPPILGEYEASQLLRELAEQVAKADLGTGALLETLSVWVGVLEDFSYTVWFSDDEDDEATSEEGADAGE